MATINIPTATAAAFPSSSSPSGVNGAGVETLYSPDTGSTIFAGATLPYPNYSGGGGSVRPSTGQIYPRGL